MKVSAKLKNLRIAPRKVRLVTNLIKGLDVQIAMDQIDANVKRSNDPVKKLLASAVSNGENNFGIDRNNMYVYDVIVGAGPTLKRWMPKAYGRAGALLKRTSQLEIILEERVEGKGRKSKEQLEKEKKEKMEAKRKAEKEAIKEEEKAEKSEKAEKVSGKTKEVKTEEKGKKVEKKGGLTSRIFRRKSM